MPWLVAVFADRLGDRQDVRLVERATQRRASMAAGAETHPLCAITDIRLARVVFLAQLIDIDEELLRSGLAGQWMDLHWITSLV